MINRRSLLAGLAGSMLAAATASAAAPSIGAIRVDVGPLLTQGWGTRAGAIKVSLERALASLRGQGRGGATLEVVVTGIHMTSFAGGATGSIGNDALESEARLIGPNGVLARYPVRAILSPGAGGAWYLPDIDQRRIDALVEANAQWIRRYLGG
jgi:hypothetical protein